MNGQTVIRLHGTRPEDAIRCDFHTATLNHAEGTFVLTIPDTVPLGRMTPGLVYTVHVWKNASHGTVTGRFARAEPVTVGPDTKPATALIFHQLQERP